MIGAYILSFLFLLASFYLQEGWAGGTQAPSNSYIDCRTLCEDTGDVSVSADQLYRQIMMPFYFVLYFEYQEKDRNVDDINYVNILELRGLDSNNNDHAFLSVYIRPSTWELEIGHNQQIVSANGPIIVSKKTSNIEITMFNGDITISTNQGGDNNPKTLPWAPEIDLSQTYYQMYITTPDTTVTDVDSKLWPVVNSENAQLKFFSVTSK